MPGKKHIRDTLSRWEKGGGKTIARTRVFDVRATRYTHPVRKTARDFYTINTYDWVNVIALTPGRRLVLVRQFRFGIDDFSIEIPGGVINPGETDLIAAGLRELREETGYEGRDARLLGSIRPNPAIMTNRCHIVLVEQCRKTGTPEWDADEEIEILLSPVDKVYEWVLTGKITHALVLDALLLFAPHWKKNSSA
jgi:8-oxo-dGTP pyrophosphatase MutT (NUDIX family)